MNCKPVLDATCGGRMMWFDKKNKHAVFVDKRVVEPTTVLCDGRHFECAPDIVTDFKKLPFADNAFKLVVMDGRKKRPPRCEVARAAT